MLSLSHSSTKTAKTSENNTSLLLFIKTDPPTPITTTTITPPQENAHVSKRQPPFSKWSGEFNYKPRNGG